MRALKLVSLLFGDKSAEEVQVTTQYFPIPPVKGSITQLAEMHDQVGLARAHLFGDARPQTNLVALIYIIHLR